MMQVPAVISRKRLREFSFSLNQLRFCYLCSLIGRGSLSSHPAHYQHFDHSNYVCYEISCKKAIIKKASSSSTMSTASVSILVKGNAKACPFFMLSLALTQLLSFLVRPKNHLGPVGSHFVLSLKHFYMFLTVPFSCWN